MGFSTQGIDGVIGNNTRTAVQAFQRAQGISAPGQSGRAVRDGVRERGVARPFNPSGGLIGGGHPVGATGIRMLVDAAAQVAGRAGEHQVDGARRAATLNIGGSTATTVSFVLDAAGEQP